MLTHLLLYSSILFALGHVTRTEEPLDVTVSSSPSPSLNESFVSIGSNVVAKNMSSPQYETLNETPFHLNKQFNNDSSAAAYAAQFNPKLLTSGTNQTQARTIEITKNAIQSAKAATSGGTTSTSLILILISLIVVTCIILVILSALFIMRRRFSIWRLNNSKLNLNGEVTENGTANGGKENTSSSEDGGEGTAAMGGDEPQLNSVENKQAIIQLEGQTNEAATVAMSGEEAKEIKIEEVKESETGGEQKSPSSESPLIKEQDTLPETTTTTTTTTKHELNEQSSSTSLIVNVLNELSESVAIKLAAKSPAKLSSDPEKQPLNE